MSGKYIFFTKNMGKTISKDIRKHVSGKYIQKCLDYAQQSLTDALKTGSKRAIQKTAETTGDLTCKKIANKITNISQT